MLSKREREVGNEVKYEVEKRPQSPKPSHSYQIGVSWFKRDHQSIVDVQHRVVIFLYFPRWIEIGVGSKTMEVV